MNIQLVLLQQKKMSRIFCVKIHTATNKMNFLTYCPIHTREKFIHAFIRRMLVRMYVISIQRVISSLSMKYAMESKTLMRKCQKVTDRKNGYAHRVQHTRFSLGVNFCTSSALTFEDF